MKKPYDEAIDLYAIAPRGFGALYISGDAETMPLRIRLTSRGAPVEPKPGAMATLNFITPGGIRFPREVPLDPDGSLRYDIQPGDLAEPGIVTVSVTSVFGSERLTWPGFTFEVGESAATDQAEPPDVLEPWTQEISRRLSELEAGVSPLPVLPERLYINEDGHLIAVSVEPPSLHINAAGHLIYTGG